VAVDDADEVLQHRAKPGEGQVFLGTAGAPPIGPGAEQLLHVYRLSEPALSELPLDQLLDELLVRTKEILGVDTVAILLVDEDGKELVARAAKGLEEEVERGIRIPIAGGFAGRIAAERTPIFIADVDHAEILNPILREKRVRSLLGVPLILDGRAVGVIHVGTLEPREFTNDNAALLQVVAARAAPAIERAGLRVAHDDRLQARTDQLIRTIKSSLDRTAAAELWGDLLADLESSGVDRVLLACTDLNVVSGTAATSLPIVDATRRLAEATVREWLRGSGSEPGRT